MPDRYGDDDRDGRDGRGGDVASVADFDSRRRARESAAAAESARVQRERLSESRAVHAPLSSVQSVEARGFQRSVTERADTRRRELRIANCGLCDDDGYRGSIICDHRDHQLVYARGMARLREAMGWDDKSTSEREGGAGTPSRAVGRSNPAGASNHPGKAGGGASDACSGPPSGRGA